MVQATVNNKYSSSGKSTSYYIEYSWLANNEYNSDKQDVGWSMYADTKIGSKVSVTILPSNPKISRLGHVDDAYLAHSINLWLGGSTCIVGLFVILRISIEVSHSREERLLESGFAVPALIKKISVSTKKGSMQRVEYEATVEGKTISRKASVDTAKAREMREGCYSTYLYTRDRMNKGFLFDEISLQKLV